MQAAGLLQLDMNEPAFYMRMLAVPSPDEQRALAALLASRLQQIEQLQRHKLDAIAALLWQLSTEGGGGGGGGGDGGGGGGGAAALPAGVERLLSRYLEDGTGEERWVPPVAREAEPERLRADLLDFARSQLSSQVKSKAAGGAGTKPGTTAASKSLSGRAVARIFHKLASPAFSSKEWKNNRYWGKHPNVDFEVLRQMAGETLETVRRANLASNKAPRAVK